MVDCRQAAISFPGVPMNRPAIVIFGVFALILLLIGSATLWLCTPLVAEGAPFEYIRIFGHEFTTGQATFYAAVSGAAFTGVGILSGLIGLVVTIGDRRKEALDKRRQRALHLSTEWASHELQTASRAAKKLLPGIRELRRLAASQEEVHDFVVRNESDRDNVIYLLNFLEDRAVAIHLGFIDEEVLELSMRAVFVFYFELLEEFIHHARVKDSETSYYEFLEKYIRRSS